MASSRQLRACAAAVNQLTAALNSSSGLSAGGGQLARLQQQVAAASAALPNEKCLSFGGDEKALLKAVLGVLSALAAERHARGPGWLELLWILTRPCSLMLPGAAINAQGASWLQRQGGSGLCRAGKAPVRLLHVADVTLAPSLSLQARPCCARCCSC
jgi:hypothetical protein